jgi:hypothetical protein
MVHYLSYVLGAVRDAHVAAGAWRAVAWCLQIPAELMLRPAWRNTCDFAEQFWHRHRP